MDKNGRAIRSAYGDAGGLVYEIALQTCVLGCAVLIGAFWLGGVIVPVIGWLWPGAPVAERLTVWAIAPGLHWPVTFGAAAVAALLWNLAVRTRAVGARRSLIGRRDPDSLE